MMLGDRSELATRLLLGAMGLAFVAQLGQSIGWGPQHDTPLLHYAAFLIAEHGAAPYSEVFETSMPGSLLFHWAIGRSVGFGDLAFRVIDIVLLVGLLVTSYCILRPFGRQAALSGPLIFALVYLSDGPSLSLQRDYVGVLLIALAVLLACRAQPRAPLVRAVAVGFLFGAAATIKPHLLLGLPLVAFLSIEWSGREKSESVSIALAAMVGVVLAAVLPLIWLWQQGALPAFGRMVATYLPLHVQLNGEHVALTGADRWIYRYTEWRALRGLGPLLVPACTGLLAVVWLGGKQLVRRAWLLAGLTATYSLYPAISGQFWSYHWLPFAYFASLTAGLACFALREAPGVGAKWVAFGSLLVAVFTCAHPSHEFLRRLTGGPPAPAAVRADAIARFLRQHLEAGDRVQSLDWAGGAVHAMLKARAVSATPYIHDYHFYHHVSHRSIQALRRDFVGRLVEAKPRFLIDVEAKSKPRGHDTTTKFAALERVKSYYDVSLAGDGFVVLERRPPLEE